MYENFDIEHDLKMEFENGYRAGVEAAQPKWISVEERLPEKDGKCIVCTAKGSVYCTRFKAYGKSGSFQTDINTHITHWMSLPEPPEVRA